MRRSGPLCIDLLKKQSGTLRLHLRLRRYGDTSTRASLPARQRVPTGPDLLHQETQKKSDIRNDADAFNRAAIGQFGDNGRIDVHADELYPGGSHISDTDAVEHGTE